MKLKMFTDLDEHPLFKQQKDQLNNSFNEKVIENQIDEEMDLEINVINRKKKTNNSIRDINVGTVSKSKSVPDLYNNNNHQLKTINQANQLDINNSSSSSNFLDDENDEDLSPFPMPDKNELIKSRTDLNVDEIFNYSTKLLNSNLKPELSNNNIFQIENNQNRLELISDFILKEKQYLALVKILIQEYYFNFANKSNFNQLINENDREIIFNHLNNLYELHKLSLLPELERRKKDWYNLSCSNRIICDLFLKHLKKINFYNDYIDNFSNSLEYLNKYCSKDNFQLKSSLCLIDIKCENKYSALMKQMTIEHPTNLTLRSLLSYVQIWPDLVNKFLIAYENFISVESVEYRYFNQIIAYFNELATKAIDSIEDVKREDLIISIQNRIGDRFSIMNKKRVLLKQGPLVTLSPQLGIIIRIYVILLNDLIIICDQNDSQFERLKPKKPLDTNGILVSDDINSFMNEQIKIKYPAHKVRHSLIVKENGFAINVPVIQKVFRFYARNLQEKLKWYQAFKTVEKAAVKPAEIDRTNIGIMMPLLMPEKLILYCSKCKSEFSPIVRKYHCRACGFIYCRNCSKSSFYLEYEKNTTKKKSRVCDYCFEFMSRNKS